MSFDLKAKAHIIQTIDCSTASASCLDRATNNKHFSSIKLFIILHSLSNCVPLVLITVVGLSDN